MKNPDKKIFKPFSSSLYFFFDVSNFTTREFFPFRFFVHFKFGFTDQLIKYTEVRNVLINRSSNLYPWYHFMLKLANEKAWSKLFKPFASSLHYFVTWQASWGASFFPPIIDLFVYSRTGKLTDGQLCLLNRLKPSYQKASVIISNDVATTEFLKLRATAKRPTLTDDEINQ